MKEKQFSAEFQKRLTLLYESLDEYQNTGIIGNLLPRLFSVCSYILFKSPYRE